MATAVPSRFACLKIEDDDYRPKGTNKAKTNNKKASTVKAQSKVGSGDAKKGNANKSVGRNEKAKQAQPKKKRNEKATEQWEEWKQKDSELVMGNFEDDLHQALLLSKLEFEAKKQTSKRIDHDKRNETEMSKEGKKQKKSKVMSLGQFNNMVAGQTENDNNCNGNASGTSSPEDTEYFSRTEQEAQKEVARAQLKETVQFRQPPSTELITSSQYKEQLDIKDKEIVSLRTEVESLKAELLTVKTRNRKLCGILGQGEMRDKAEVLVEVERLTKVQDELTAEVQSLHAQLEQEKSKVRSQTDKDGRGKDKFHIKSVRFDVSTEINRQ